MHGYELKTAYENDLNPTAKLNFGQVYTTLERLTRDGLVEFEEVNQSEKPDKKVYSLTVDGQEQLKQWLSQPTLSQRDQRNETFLKMMLARRVKRFDPLKCLVLERRACVARLHEVTQGRIQAERDGAPIQTLLMLELTALQLDAFLKWLDRCEEILDQEQTK